MIATLLTLAPAPRAATARRTAIAVLAAVLAATALTGARADASTVSAGSDTITLTAAPGERNAVFVKPSATPGVLFIFDDAGATAGAGCAQGSRPTLAICPGSAVRADLGDGNDRYATEGGVTADVNGGDGNDELSGDNVSVTLAGGPGDDTLRPDCWNRILAHVCPLGQPVGDADVLSGGDGRDAVSYHGHIGPLRVTLDGVADDGAAGERDNVLADVEDVAGTDLGPNVLIGSGAPNLLEGGPAADQLAGGDGDDRLFAIFGAVESGVAYGDDVLDGGSGADSVYGSPANDQLTGGPGADKLIGAAGNDRLLANDQEADTDIVCDEGDDTAIADALDAETYALDVTTCEHRQITPTPGATARMRAFGRPIANTRRLKLKVRCSGAPGATCRGEVRVVSRARAGRSTRTIGRRRLALAAASKRTVSVRLRGVGRLLRARRAVRLRVIVASEGGGKQAATVTVRRPAGRRR